MANIIHSFDLDDEGWRSYDYELHHEGVPVHAMRVAWELAGGVDGGGYIWADDKSWTIDTPEQPHSILALFTYRRWRGLGSLDLRGAEVSVHLRGDGLDLLGGTCTFWVVTDKMGKHSRWHFVAKRLQIPDGRWSEAQRLVLENDESQWHHSWTHESARDPRLDDALGHVDSYGIAFVGFSEKVTGRLSLDELRIRTELGEV